MRREATLPPRLVRGRPCRIAGCLKSVRQAIAKFPPNAFEKIPLSRCGVPSGARGRHRLHAQPCRSPRFPFGRSFLDRQTWTLGEATMESLRSTRPDDVQQLKRENAQPKDAYRAPRLVTLGTATDLVQGGRGSIQETYGRWSYSVR